MRLSLREVESFFSRIKNSCPTAVEADSLQMEVIGNHVRLFSTLEGNPSNGIIDLEKGVLTTTSGYRDPGEGPNRLLDQPYFLDGMTVIVDGHISFRSSNDNALLGRITSISCHLNSHRKVSHEMPVDYPAVTQKDGDCPLFPLKDLSGGHERVYWIPVSERAYSAYERFVAPLKNLSSILGLFYLDLSIDFHYWDSSLLKCPLRPDEILVRAKVRSTHENLKYELNITNN